MPRTGHPATRHVAAVSRAVAVLDALAEGSSELGTNDIARRTAINASTVSRLLATLAEAGLVEHRPETGRYRLGLRIIQLGQTALSRFGLQEIARPHLRALAEATGETATLSIPGEREAVTLDFVQGGSSVQSVARVGRTSVAHATAVGKVWLAYGGALPEADLPAYTDRTITDPGTLAAEIEQTRERGWATATGEREPDLNGVAAPIRRPTGELAAILGIQGPAGRFDGEAMRAAAGPLVERAGRIPVR